MNGTSLPMLDGDAVRRLLPIADCIEALADAVAATGERAASFVGAVRADGGTFHLKSAFAPLHRPLFAAKVNANFPGNHERGLPTIQGVLLLFDGADGRPLAVMDSAALTVIRTAAASGLMARHLAPPAARRAAIVGCGAQALAQLSAMCAVRSIASASLFDLRPDAARRLADHSRRSLGIDVEVASSVGECVADADVIVTCTTSRAPILLDEHVRRSDVFIAAVGADSPDKRELDTALMARATLVADDVAQCAEIGELHHAITAGALRPSDVWRTFAEVVGEPSPPPPGRPVIFDSTGIPIEDLAAAALVHERTRAAAAQSPAPP